MSLSLRVIFIGALADLLRVLVGACLLCDLAEPGLLNFLVGGGSLRVLVGVSLLSVLVGVGLLIVLVGVCLLLGFHTISVGFK